MKQPQTIAKDTAPRAAVKPATEQKASDLPKHEITSADRDRHVKSLRDLVQMIHNRNDQDTNKVLANMRKHLDALDGNPEEREAARHEAEQNRAQAEKRAQRDVGDDRLKAEANNEKAKVA